MLPSISQSHRTTALACTALTFTLVVVGRAQTPVGQENNKDASTKSSGHGKPAATDKPATDTPTADPQNQKGDSKAPATKGQVDQGKLIYQGNPLTVRYHGGVLFGVSFPIYLKSAVQPSS